MNARANPADFDIPDPRMVEIAQQMAPDLASPEACTARSARIQAANEAHRIRVASLDAARAVVRKYKVRGPFELLQAMQNISANFEGLDSIGVEYVEKLRELCTDMDADMNAGEPELSAYAYEPRGELDSQAPRSNRT